MKIQYFGHSCFYLKNKTVSVLMDPFNSQMVGLKMPKVEADIVTVSHQHEDHNFVSACSNKPVVFDFPGEYEVGGVKVYGYQSFHDDQQGLKRGENIIFKVVINNVVLTHLGDLGHIPDEQLIDELEDTDVLLVPVGGVYTINVSQAKQIVELIKPAITIPMHYRSDKHSSDRFGSLAELPEFLKLMGQENLVAVKRIEIKSEEDLPERELVVLEPDK